MGFMGSEISTLLKGNSYSPFANHAPPSGGEKGQILQLSVFIQVFVNPLCNFSLSQLVQSSSSSTSSSNPLAATP
ncbi:hypothetical protein M378DRAFT_169035 [Amanita muscaria Koide BX008]|uniref:Uncharacterized protein n=1 Tax=Amanita muscaria (strain Koide BX008) TaxID=946122 RepID=A0A0C2SA22_AMAMK|nr:hypothetical protein M378DRAFT_169035 [Amanita muscaria Koide BX008]